MKVTVIQYPKNDWMPKTQPGAPYLFVLSSPYDPAKPNSKYWLRCYKCGLTANLGLHEVQITGDNVTISPSILCPREGCGAHYWIKDSQIQA